MLRSFQFTGFRRGLLTVFCNANSGHLYVTAPLTVTQSVARNYSSRNGFRQISINEFCLQQKKMVNIRRKFALMHAEKNWNMVIVGCYYIIKTLWRFSIHGSVYMPALCIIIHCNYQEATHISKSVLAKWAMVHKLWHNDGYWRRIKKSYVSQYDCYMSPRSLAANKLILLTA